MWHTHMHLIGSYRHTSSIFYTYVLHAIIAERDKKSYYECPMNVRTVNAVCTHVAQLLCAEGS